MKKSPLKKQQSSTNSVTSGGIRKTGRSSKLLVEDDEEEEKADEVKEPLMATLEQIKESNIESTIKTNDSFEQLKLKSIGDKEDSNSKLPENSADIMAKIKAELKSELLAQMKGEIKAATLSNTIGSDGRIPSDSLTS